MNLVKQANHLFKNGDFLNAHELYIKASNIYKYKHLDFNIKLCKKRINDNRPTLVTDVDEPSVAYFEEPSKEKSFLNQYFDNIYIVNLKHKVSDKLKVTHHLNQHGIDFEVFDATNGYVGEPLKQYQEYASNSLGNLTRYSNFNDREIKQGSLFLGSAGAVGYIHTYLRILSDAKSQGYKRFLILEDDIMLSKNFESKFQSFIQSIDDEWKILQLGASQYGWGSVNFTQAKEDGFYLPRTMDTKGSFAIAFDATIIDELIEAESAFEAPFDHAPMGELYEKYLGSCFVAYPYIIVPDVGESSIRDGRCQFTHSKRMKWPLELFDYPLNKPSISVIITSKANLKYYNDFSNVKDFPFNLRLYFYTEDGMRPLHNVELLDSSANKIIPINEHVILLESDYIVTLDEDKILTESDLVKFIEHKVKIRKENLTELREIKAHFRKVVKNRVSVIIPTYKRPKNLRNALESVVNQNYSDIEVIVISDNGYSSEFNEETRSIVESMNGINANFNVVLLEHSVNRNGSAARNTGIAYSTGEFISLLDDDDIYLPGRLSQSINALKEKNKNIGAVYCGFLGWNSPENDLNRYKTGDLTLDILLLDYKKHYLHTNTATYRREAVLNINGFDESYRRHQDLEFNLRFFEQYEMDALKECLVRLNPEPSGVSNKAFNTVMLDLKLKFLTQFHYLIEGFSLEVQRNIYSLHQDECLKYIKEKEKTFATYRNNFQDYSAQMTIKLVDKLNPKLINPLANDHSCKKDIGFYRIIGNNIPNLHSKDQSYESMKFIIENEPNFNRVDKFFVLNRIIDSKVKDQIVSYLESNKMKYLDITFDSDEYKKIGYDFKNLSNSGYWFGSRTNWQRLAANAAIRASKNRYLMNNNGARNFALHHGRERYDWSMPWDGNCFLSEPHYDELQAQFISSKEYKYVTTPMERLSSNSGLNSQSISKDSTEEPQISFFKNTTETFNEERVYGNQPKVELFKRIGVVGVWDEYVNLYPWKKLEYSKSTDFGLVASTSAVFRLFSGNEAAINSKNRSHTRAEGLADFIDEVETYYVKTNLLSLEIKKRFLAHLNKKIESVELKQLNVAASKVFSSSLTVEGKELKFKSVLNDIVSLSKTAKDSRTRVECALILFARNLSRKKKVLGQEILLMLSCEKEEFFDEASLKNTENFKQYFYHHVISMLLKLAIDDLQGAVKHKLELAMLMYYFYENKIETDSGLSSCFDVTFYVLQEFFEYDCLADLKEVLPENVKILKKGYV